MTDDEQALFGDVNRELQKKLSLEQAAEIWGALIYVARALDIVVKGTNGRFIHPVKGEPDILIADQIRAAAERGGFRDTDPDVDKEPGERAIRVADHSVEG